MWNFNVWSLVGLVCLICCCTGRTLFEPEDAAAVVSKYTTPSPPAQAPPPLDIYRQIANNIAERITSPIYHFLGYYGSNATAAPAAPAPTRASPPPPPARAHLELVDDTSDEAPTVSVEPLDNEIETERDVEELSPERINKVDGSQPEKVTLYSSYLPADGSGGTGGRAAQAAGAATQAAEGGNSTSSLPDDDDFDFDEFAEPDSAGGGGGGFAYVLELAGSLLTLAWGAVVAYFGSSSGAANN